MSSVSSLATFPRPILRLSWGSWTNTVRIAGKSAGVTASLWVGLVCSILAFNADLFAILGGFQLDVHMRNVMSDYYTALTPDAFMSKHIGGHLASSMAGLRTLPLLAVAIGIIGAGLGGRRRVDSAFSLRARP